MRSCVVWIGAAVLAAGALTGCGRSEPTQSTTPGAAPTMIPTQSGEVQRAPAPPPKKP